MGKITNLLESCAEPVEVEAVKPKASGKCEPVFEGSNQHLEIFINTKMGMISEEQFKIISEKIKSECSDELEIYPRLCGESIICRIHSQEIGKVLENIGKKLIGSVENVSKDILGE